MLDLPLLLLALTAVASAQELPLDDPSAEAPGIEPGEAPLPPIPTELERAKEAYFGGGHEEAIAILSELRDRIERGAAASPQTRAEVGIYLGEVLLLLKDQESAWGAFRWLLLKQPDIAIQPALHPPEVVTWFEAARAEVHAELQREAEEPSPVIAGPSPLPVWGYAPFGIPQFVQKHPVRGALYGTGQAAASGLSVGVFVHLLQVNRRDHPEWLTEEELVPYVRKWRNGVQWPSTAVFYALWAASSFDARATWNTNSPRLDLVPTGEGAELRLSGRF
jgi:hypothetical protein